MKKIVAAILFLALLLGALVSLASPAHAGEEPVEFCHALGGGKYLLKSETADQGIINGHAGPSHQNGADIIPAFSYVENKVRQYFPGQNLDKLYLIDKGCKEDAVPVKVNPNAPTYAPPTCADPSNAWGRVTIPTDLGNGVASSTPAILNVIREEESAEWKVVYTIKPNDDDFAYSWNDGNPEATTAFVFNATHISSDPLWVVDSKTGKGQCELSNTGMSGLNTNALVIAGGLLFAGMIFLGTTNFIGRRRNA